MAALDATARDMLAETDVRELMRITTRVRELRRKLDAIRIACPLAFAELWQPACRACKRTMRHLGGLRHQCADCGTIEIRTSQQAAIRSMLADRDLSRFVLLGGNRSGKTEGLTQVCGAFAEGADSPTVKRWARINDLSLARIQPGPGRVWMIAQTFGAAIEYLRPKLSNYLPKGTALRAWGANAEGVAELPGGGVVVSKAVEQAKASRGGKNPFEGAAINAALFDEEPHVQLAVDSVDWRLIDFRGPTMFSMTPLSGWTPFLVRTVGHLREGQPAPAGLQVHHLHGEDNPHIDSAELLRRAERYPEAIQRARLRGEIVALDGRVHEGFERRIHVVESFLVPAGWVRFGAIDFGTRAPFCHLWAALDPADDVLHVYAEHYAAGLRTSEHAAHIWRFEACPACYPSDAELNSPEWWLWRLACVDGRHQCEVCGGTGRREPEMHTRWADPEALDARLTLNGEYDIATALAHKARRTGWEAIEDRLKPDAEGKPHLLIHDCCTSLIRELEGLTWLREEPGAREESELSVKGDDHAWDALRYLCVGIRRAGFGHYEDLEEESA
ncbi:MAG TPA: hypothetical protein DCQ64_00045 [Candidatus Rokubacteria bacterium]|nr:hypothetical protein [Candidatus Rokubacteria bacterium]